MKTIAFIPVRGGSKSIPLKNIKDFCGKPLVCWNIEALEACDLIDEIIIATDSDIIEKTVLSRPYKKVYVYRRSEENANDTASTESVMLEYINAVKLTDETFILVQATSPLTETKHFEEALQMYHTGVYDSIITCVKNFRFFWNADGTSKNYDYKNRPRRQNFDGMYMENGAFYINSVQNIKRDRNRLSGTIGIYEMPEYTGTEIDEPTDWTILESIMRSKRKSQSSIKLFVSDIDGVLTDGGMYYTEDGNEMKKFNTKDGVAFSMLRENNVKTAIITGENTSIVSNRAKKMQVDYLFQGVTDKITVLKGLCSELGISLDEVAYIGDDIGDIDCLYAVGIAACPADAISLVKEISNIIILKNIGGNGCVREFVNNWLNII